MPLSSGRKGSNRIWTEKSFRRWKCRTLAKFYGDNGADELLVFDFSSADAEHDRAIGKIRDICQASEIPVIAAGNIKRMEDVKTDLCRLCQGCIKFFKEK